MNTEVRGGLEVVRTQAVGSVAPAVQAEQPSQHRPERPAHPEREPAREPARDRLELSREGRAAAREARDDRLAQDRRIERQEREHRVRGEMRTALSREKPPYRGRARAAEAHRELREISAADERDRAERQRARHAARRAYREVAALRPENGLLG